MQRIRTHLFDGVGLPRAHGTVRGYWKARGTFRDPTGGNCWHDRP